MAAEILYFADCIQTDLEPEPSGQGGLIDVRIIEALRQSYSEHRPILLEPLAKSQRPDQSQSIERPPARQTRAGQCVAAIQRIAALDCERLSCQLGQTVRSQTDLSVEVRDFLKNLFNSRTLARWPFCSKV